MPSLSRPAWPKVLAAALGLLVLLGMGATLVLNHLFPRERLAALLAAQVSATTGRDFQVRGPLSVRLLPRIGVAAQDVSLGNTRWGSRPNMLAVRQARFDLGLWPLLQGRVAIASVELQGVDLLLETDKSGAGNWVFSPPGASAPSAPSAPATPSRLELQRLSLADARLGFRDGRSGQTRTLAIERLDLDDAGDGQQLDARFEFGALDWQLHGRIGRLAELAANEADWPFDLQLQADGATLGAKGQLRRGASPRAAEADVQAQLVKPQALAPWLADAAAVPLPIDLKARLHASAQAVRAEALQLSVAGQALSGQFKAQAGTPWKVDALLASPSIDLARWRPPRTTAPAAKAGARQWVFSEAPLALDALPTFALTLALRVDKLLVPALPPIAGLNLQTQSSAGRLKIDPLNLGIAGGTLRGSVGLASAAGGAPRLTLQAQASNLSIDALLKASGHSTYASGGQLQMRADLAMSGSSMRALAAGASGELLLSAAGTTLGGGASPLGTDLLPQLLESLGRNPRTRIDCAVVRLPLKNGVAQVERSIALETDQLAISAKGQVRFDDETLELALRPAAKTGSGVPVAGLAQLALVKGPWLQPKLSLDPQGVAGMAATIGAAGLSGGWSVLAQQMLKSPVPTQACRAALGLPVDTPPAAPAQNKPAPALPQAVPEALRKIFR